jgi:CubicO group peptidase (beta-lactamase class C family)
VVAALAEELSGAAARQTIQELSLHHRMRGSEGFRAAAEALRERALAYGLEGVEILELPADGEIFYGTQRSRPAWDVDGARLWEQREVDGAWVDARLIADWSTRPITLAQDSASGAASGDLVDVGAGTSAADYEGKEIGGKIVLTSSQPGAVHELALVRGAVGIVSYAQNQRSAWWGEDRNLVRWGHLDTFPPPRTFAFMVTVNEALAFKERLESGERVRLRAEVETRRHAGSYDIVTAVIPGGDPDLRQQEVVYSCHLDHQRPGANDNASGCAAILEVARALNALVKAGSIPAPRRTMRFIWPPEIEGTIALLNARPDLAVRARAVVHMDMVGGLEDVTRSILHVTRSPRSLPTVLNDVAEAFGRFVNEQSYRHSAGEAVDYPLLDPEGSRQALQARIADFSTGSDHQVWTEGSFRVPAIYLNDWPDRYIHTHADGPGNIDPTKLLRAAFIGAASGYYLASLRQDDVPELIDVVRGHALERTAEALRRAARLDEAEGANLLRQHSAYERGVLMSIGSLAPWPAAERGRLLALSDEIAELAGSAPAPTAPPTGDVCTRQAEPKGPMWGFGYSWLEAQLERRGLERPELLSHDGLWGSGSEYAYEVLNLTDGRRTVSQIRDAVAAIYGPVPEATVGGYLEALEAIGLLECGEPVSFAAMMGASTAPLAERAPRFPPPEDPIELGLAGLAKVVCTAVFVTGREADEATRNSANIFLPPDEFPDPGDVEVDTERKEVRLRRNGAVVRTARLFGDQGCVILPAGEGGVFFEPVAVESSLPDAASIPWPGGDLDARADLDSLLGPGVDPAAVEAAVDLAFAPEALTQAFVVVHKGKIVVERYAPGTDLDTQLESWSMGKSLTATLIGVLVEQGALEVEQPAPIDEWHEAGDPRSEIRVLDLLQMSSGLRFYSHHDSDWTPAHGYLEHFYIYTGAIDVFDFSISRPAQFPPGTEGRYRNSDPLTLGYLVKKIVSERGEEYLTFPQRALFDRVGIRRQLLEPDPWGNFVLSGYDYGTARNWARLGMLYLNDGVFEGERVLPEGWASLVSTPAPAWRLPRYGGMFWLNHTGQFDLPADAYAMAGAGSQYTIIVPSLDLVVVRMGRLAGGGPGHQALNQALPALTRALGLTE